MNQPSRTPRITALLATFALLGATQLATPAQAQLIADSVITTNAAATNTFAGQVGVASLVANNPANANAFPRGDGTWQTVIPGSSGNYQQQIDQFTTPGATNWTRPTWASKYTVYVIGGGGGGGAGSTNYLGYGGSAGGCAIRYFGLELTNSTVSVVVGASGAGATYPATKQGGAGQTSSFGAFCSASGGGGGGLSVSSAGTGSGGTLNILGGSAAFPGGGLSFGGSSFMGGGAGSAAYTKVSGGTASASSWYAANPPQGAFDGSVANQLGWGNNNSMPCWLEYDFAGNTAQTITRYRIYCASDQVGGWNSENNTPKTWDFQGSNDGSTWTTLHHVDDGALMMNQWGTFNFSNTGAYAKYRISISAAKSGSWTHISELELYSQLSIASAGLSAVMVGLDANTPGAGGCSAGGVGGAGAPGCVIIISEGGLGSNGSGSINITPAQIGAVSSSDIRYLTALTNAAQFATAAQGALANTALQPTGSGANLTGITAAKVGAVSTNDPSYLAAITNLQPNVTLGSNLTILGSAQISNSLFAGVGLASADPSVRFLINANTASPTDLSGMTDHPFIFVGSNGVRSRVMIDCYANGNNAAAPILTFRSANGTAAAPTATTAGFTLANLGYQGFGTSNRVANTKAFMLVEPVGTWTDNSQPARVTILTSTTNPPNYTVTRQRWWDDGGIEMGGTAAMQGVSPGAGITKINGTLQVANVTGITAAQVGAVSTSVTITINGNTGRLNSNLTFTVSGGGGGGGGGNVDSVFGRAGVVVAATGDYTAAQVGAVSTTDPIYLATLTNAAQFATAAQGAKADAALQPNGNGSQLSNITAAQVGAAVPADISQALQNIGPYGDVSMGSYTTRGQ